MKTLQFKTARMTGGKGLWIVALAVLWLLSARQVRAETTLYVAGHVRGQNGVGVVGVRVAFSYVLDYNSGSGIILNKGAGPILLTTDADGFYSYIENIGGTLFNEKISMSLDSAPSASRTCSTSAARDRR